MQLSLCPNRTKLKLTLITLTLTIIITMIIMIMIIIIIIIIIVIIIVIIVIIDFKSCQTLLLSVRRIHKTTCQQPPLSVKKSALIGQKHVQYRITAVCSKRNCYYF